VTVDVPTYELPERSIAQTPVEPRDAARLLVAVDPAGRVEHRRVADLAELVGPGDVMVVNTSRVLPARLHLTKRSGGAAEVLLLEPAPGGRPGCWEALVRPGRRLAPGTELLAGGRVVVIVGERVDGGRRLVDLVDLRAETDAGTVAGTVAGTGGAGGGEGGPLSGVAPDPSGARPEGPAPDAVGRFLAGVGEIPLPPYIRRPLADPERYQTVYADQPGSVAAPTAGLHLTRPLLAACRAAGAAIVEVDLAVGLGTFRPVTAGRAEDHDMHTERYEVPKATLAACRDARRVIAVGTTTVRALETAAATGEPSGRSRLFIHGDYPWRAVDVLMTNFHQPRSTLLLLLEAFCGPRWRDLYATALDEGYRFLSFGDAMIVGGGRGRR
jgi:S-adenosylmethionine:tRNA ribosyltransferase-isomerase